jgi:ABC-type transporter Mla subunit MlaD
MIRRLAAILVVLGACAAAVVLTGAKDETEKGTKLKIAFDNAFGLTEGGDLRVGGVRAGVTEKINISKGPECQGATPGDGPPRTCAVVDGKITEKGFASFRDDLQCDIRQQSLIGEYFVDCQNGKSPRKWDLKRTIPVTKTHSTVPADLINNVLRRPYRERLRLIIAELGTGLAGRPQDLAELLRRAHPGLRETSKVLRILGDQNKIIQDFIVDSDTVVRELEREKKEVARWVDETGETAEISASRRDEIAAGFRRLPTFLGELRPTMARLGELADEQTPLLRDLQRAAPSLDEFFTRLGPFSEASRPAFRSLGDASVKGLAAIRESGDEINELRRFARNAPGVGRPLRQFLQTWDDRKYAFDTDPRAAQTAPPAPDPTASDPGRGFTGYEAFWNYWYWQALAINQFDRFGHTLRVLGIEPGKCVEFGNGAPEEREEYERCNAWLGPFQPGINRPDPTDADGPGGGATRTPPGVPRRATRREYKRAGQTEAGPLPGRPDYSKPTIVLPPQLRQLIGDARSRIGPGGGPNSEQLLDYLLGP